MKALNRIISLLMVALLLTASVPFAPANAVEACAESYSLTIEETYNDPGLSENSALYGMTFFGSTEFDGCYGNQLSGVTKELYTSFVKNYVTDKKTGEYTHTFETPFIFDAEISEGSIVMNDELEEIGLEISCAMQTAMDAFLYDHPEVFWLKIFGLSYSISASGDSANGYKGRIEEILITPTEIYSGASAKASQYSSAVQNALDAITVTESRYDTLKNIHDYICNNAWYNLVNEQRVHSSEPFFIGDGGVVCEGYAKSFKILCDRLDIPCVLASGYAGEDHMWNYVQMDDGKWYLVDVTWDDQKSGIYDTYFIANANTIGFDYVTISEERTERNDFSGTGIFGFTYPVLSDTAYGIHVHEWDSDYTVDVEPTCTEDGLKSKVCTFIGCKAKLSEVIPPAGHKDSDYNAECDVCFGSVNDIEIGENIITIKKNDDIYLSFTATKDGRYTLSSEDMYISIDVYNEDKSEYEHDIDESSSMCTLKAGQKVYWRIKNALLKERKIIVKLNRTEPHIHDFSSITVIKDDDCTAAGIRIASCSCGATSTTVIPATEHKPVIDKAITSTCSKTGLTEGSHCSVCKAVIKKQNVVAKKAHTYKTTVTKATLSKNGKTETKCTVCGYISKTTVIYTPKTVKLSATSYTYNGEVKTPSVTVKDTKGNTLKKDTDYTVTYEKGRKNPGSYSVRIDFKGKYEGTKRLYFTIAPKATSKITATQTTTTITLKWNKVTGADGYRVYKYNSKTKKYEKLKDVTGTSLKISKLKEGTAYKYKVRAYTKDDGTIWGAYSSAFETATKCKTPSITKLTTTKGKVSFTWSNVSGESGYQVYYSTKKDSGYKKVTSYKANVVKGSKSKLTSKKTYYFKVRAYKKTASGTVYSAWSSAKSIKVK